MVPPRCYIVLSKEFLSSWLFPNVYCVFIYYCEFDFKVLYCQGRTYRAEKLLEAGDVARINPTTNRRECMCATEVTTGRSKIRKGDCKKKWRHHEDRWRMRWDNGWINRITSETQRLLLSWVSDEKLFSILNLCLSDGTFVSLGCICLLVFQEHMVETAFGVAVQI